MNLLNILFKRPAEKPLALTDRGGYEYVFIDNVPDRYICKICHSPSRDPQLTVCCGNVFCKSCLETAKLNPDIGNACPTCRNVTEFNTFPNKQLDREIRSLHVMCTNKERGCEWQGELNDINNHLENSNGCQFVNVACSNKCGKMLQRRYLTSHVETECPRRKVDCQYCQITREYEFIEGEHKKQCPKLPLPCPNDCDVGSVPRQDMEAHKKECPLEEIECFAECGKILQRQYLTDHVDYECPRRNVDCQYCHITGEHQFIEGEHNEQCPKLPLPCPNKCEIGSVPREDMKVHRKECPLEMVQCEYHNVGCEERMIRKYLDGHNKDNTEEHLSLAVSKLDGALKQINALTIILNHMVIPQVQGTSSSVVSVAIWSVQLTAMAVLSKSDNGRICPVTINICGFNKKKENEFEWYSDIFHSESKGYEMWLRVDAAGNGGGKDTHLSVFLYLMKGPHDDKLAWPLKGKFQVTLLNQISDCKHHTVTVSNDDRIPDSSASRFGKSSDCWGKRQFISNEDLHKVTPTCQYLKDDCIFFHVSKL